MASTKKVPNPRLTLVKKDGVKNARSEIEVVSYEKLSLAQISVLNSYLSTTESVGNCVGALVGLDEWDIRPLVIEDNKLTITRFTQPEGDGSDYKKFMSFGKTLQLSSKLTNVTGFGSTTDQLWIKRIFYQSTMRDKLASFIDLSFSEKKQHCISLANLLGRLHQKKIVHGNISLSNIAWIESQPIYLDFGFAAISGQTEFYTTIAPEIQQGASPTLAGDIYGLGKVFSSLIDSIKSLPLAALINDMTQNDPDRRPNLDKVIDFFEDKKEDTESEVISVQVPGNYNADLLNPKTGSMKEKEILVRSKPSNTPWYIAFVLVVLAAGFYLYNFANQAGDSDGPQYDQSSYTQLWQTSQPSMMQIVAREAIEKGDKIAQSVIIKDIMSASDEKLSEYKLLNGALIKTAFDPRWEAGLTTNDRKIIIILATAGIFSDNIPAMPNLMNASPVVLLSLMGTLQTDTPIKDFAGISIEKLGRLPPPYDRVFKEYSKYRQVKLDDASVRALSHIALGKYDDKMLNTFFQPAAKEVDLFKMVRVILPLVPHVKNLDSDLHSYLLVRSMVFAQAYRWFDEESFTDWNAVDRSDKIAIVSGIFPDKQLPFEKYADLLKHPNPRISKEAAQIMNSKFYGGKLQPMLDYLASDQNKFTRYQTISILAALSLQGKEASDFYMKWFQSKPEVNSVVDFLVLRADSKTNDIFNLTAAQYLSDKEWTASHETLRKLVLHPETLARALAYSKLDKSKPEDLALLNSMSIAEPNPRLRDQIRKIIDN